MPLVQPKSGRIKVGHEHMNCSSRYAKLEDRYQLTSPPFGEMPWPIMKLASSEAR